MQSLGPMSTDLLPFGKNLWGMIPVGMLPLGTMSFRELPSGMS
jgi:hypothetical protein